MENNYVYFGISMSQFEHALLFKLIVDHQSLAKAAHHSGLNASAVSKQLAKLESSLGTQLLKRTTRRLALTEAGQYFYEKITKLQYEWFSALDETSSLGKEVKGVLRIASPQPLLSRFLMPILAEFQQAYPSITFEFMHQPIEQLPSITADISISREILHYDSNTTVMVPFYTYCNRLFASPEYLSQYSAIEQASQLQQHSCLIYQGLSAPVTWAFEAEEINLIKTIVFNSAEIMISAAKNGLGVVYLPEEILQEELKQKQLVQILPNLQSKPYKTCAYYTRADFVSQKVRVLLDFLKSKQNGKF